MTDLDHLAAPRPAPNPDHHESGLRAFLHVLRKWRVLIAVCVIVTTGAAVGLALVQTKVYSATATLLFHPDDQTQALLGGGTVNQFQDPTRTTATNVDLVTLTAVAQRTAQALDHGLTRQTVQDEVRVAPQGISDLVLITARDHDPKRAAAIATTVGQQYIAFRRDADRSKIAQALTLVRQQIAALGPGLRNSAQGHSLQNRAEQLLIAESLQTGNAQLVQPAVVPTSPASPTPARNGVIGALLGLLLGVGAALVLDRLDRRLTDPDSLKDAFGLPLLGVVPESSLLRAHDPHYRLPAREGEAFALLRARLQYFNLTHQIKTVIVTSASAGEGKTTTAWNLAAAAALSGSNVLLLEADMRRPSLAALLRLNREPGLAEVISGMTLYGEVIQTVTISREATGEFADGGGESTVTCDVMVAGADPPNPIELLGSERMAESLQTYAEYYDLVVIDAPPVPVVPDALPLITQVDGVIVVGALGVVTRDMARRLREELHNLHAPLLGVVANHSREVPAEYYAGYAYAYAN